MPSETAKKSGSFLAEETQPGDILTIEDLGEAHKMIVSTTEDFVNNEVRPHLAQLEHKDFALSRHLIRQAGELGLLGADVSEEYGGSGPDLIASLLIDEHLAGAASFGVTMNDHVGIGTLPLVFFGNESQKQKYLPALASGTSIGAYALTEPKAGTDALSIETRATLTTDGSCYRLNGTKQFVTNGGLADVVFTYAKVDGDKFTAFIVERGFDGVSVGPEEKKMGIRGTSTTSLVLDDALVPVDNVLFEVGRGHLVAFNILNLARLKLGVGCIGMSKLALQSSVTHAKERVQFGRPICDFGLIKHKIAEMAIRTYVAESMAYRIGGLVHDLLTSAGQDAYSNAKQAARYLPEYAIECSMNKVYCSEALAYVADEAVQICGGYGYIEEYPVETIYRDCRIYRIFEGTNEINRLVTTRWLVAKLLKKELAVPEQGLKPPEGPTTGAGGRQPLRRESELLSRARRAFVWAANAAVQAYGDGLDEEQEVCGLLADMATEVYAMESGLLRAIKSIESVGEERSAAKIDMVTVYADASMARVADCLRQLVPPVAAAGADTSGKDDIMRLAHFAPINAVPLRRRLADLVVSREGYAC